MGNVRQAVIMAQLQAKVSAPAGAESAQLTAGVCPSAADNLLRVRGLYAHARIRAPESTRQQRRQPRMLRRDKTHRYGSPEPANAPVRQYKMTPVAAGAEAAAPAEHEAPPRVACRYAQPRARVCFLKRDMARPSRFSFATSPPSTPPPNAQRPRPRPRTGRLIPQFERTEDKQCKGGDIRGENGGNPVEAATPPPRRSAPQRRIVMPRLPPPTRHGCSATARYAARDIVLREGSTRQRRARR